MNDNYSQFKAGVYRHYKNHLYLVLGLAHDANEDRRTVVVYVGLELDKSKSGVRLATRTYEDFYAWVDPKTGKQAIKTSANAVQRFEYVGQTVNN